MKAERTREGCTVKRRYYNTETGQDMEEIDLSCEIELSLEDRGTERFWTSGMASCAFGHTDPWRYERKR